MSATNYFENALLALLFNATAISNLADNAVSSPATDLYVSLHTGDPGEAGDQTTNEANYTSYARVAVNRDSGGWSVVNDEATNIGAITFPTCTGGSSTVTHFGIGLGSSGAGTLLLKGALSSSLAVSNGITPSFQPGELDVTVN